MAILLGARDKNQARARLSAIDSIVSEMGFTGPSAPEKKQRVLSSVQEDTSYSGFFALSNSPVRNEETGEIEKHVLTISDLTGRSVESNRWSGSVMLFGNELTLPIIENVEFMFYDSFEGAEYVYVYLIYNPLYYDENSFNNFKVIFTNKEISTNFYYVLVGRLYNTGEVIQIANGYNAIDFIIGDRNFSYVCFTTQEKLGVYFIASNTSQDRFSVTVNNFVYEVEPNVIDYAFELNTHYTIGIRYTTPIKENLEEDPPVEGREAKAELYVTTADGVPNPTKDYVYYELARINYDSELVSSIPLVEIKQSNIYTPVFIWWIEACENE